jgi:dihydropteroate synthase
MVWKHKRGELNLSRRGAIMGILNVTPDSFSDGGSFSSGDEAVAHALLMEKSGADIIDVGGESTRPGAAAVSEAEELCRVIPVIRNLRAQSEVLISVDTSKAAVAKEAVLAGADIINDVTALRGDSAMPEVALHSGAGLVLMHMQGRPRTMQDNPRYLDVVGEVAKFLRQALASALECGMSAERIALDPGIGFGKMPAHNLALLQSLEAFAPLQRPLLIGVSRKSFLASLADSPAIADRFWPAVALTSYCREHGARIFRVHEPQPHHEALRMTEAILNSSS